MLQGACVRRVSDTFAEKVVQKQRSRTVVMYLNPYSRQGENFTRERLHKQDFCEDVKKNLRFLSEELLRLPLCGKTQKSVKRSLATSFHQK